MNLRAELRTTNKWVPPTVMATIGPTLEKPDDLRQAIVAGARWFRFPCGYRQRPHVENALAARAASEAVQIPVDLLLDLPSSRPRTGTMTELRLNPGQSVRFWDPESSAPAPASNGIPAVPLPGLAHLTQKLEPNHRMWFCDGRLTFVVESLDESTAVARLEQGTIPLKSSNSLFLPDSPSPFSVTTEADRALLRAFASASIPPDWVALSLISSPDDVVDGRREAEELIGRPVKIMAKFETEAAVACAAAIIEQADGLMVARGDLGLAVGYARLPGVQEELVAAARRAGKVAVVATQVMEVFAETGLPQRAEISDLSLIARQRADAVMLGKETVFSPRPLECIAFAREVLTYETRRFEAAQRKSPRAANREVLPA